MHNKAYPIIATAISILLVVFLLHNTLSNIHSTLFNPVDNIKEEYVANFGEIRSNSFHLGIDIWADEGSAIHAVNNGYISRIIKIPESYGFALFVTHADSTQSVYAHLSAFRPDITQYVTAYRHQNKVHTFELDCTPEQFPVHRGEIIALSGNTGTSQGPHLHFELRDLRRNSSLNTIRKGYFVPMDDIAPMMYKIHYIEVDTIDCVPRHSPLVSYALKRVDNNNYSLHSQREIKVGRQGYFVIECQDTKSNLHFKYGIYNIKAYIDNKLYFEYKIDDVPLELSRQSNAISYYPLQIDSRYETIRLSKLENSTDYFYPTIVNQGVISTTEGERRQIHIELTDDCGNTSHLKFSIVGRNQNECFEATTPNPELTAYAHKNFSYEIPDTLHVDIPSGALYEATEILCRRDTLMVADTTLVMLSPSYAIGSRSIPLEKPMRLTFKHDIDDSLASRSAIALLDTAGMATYSHTQREKREFTTNTYKMGYYCIVADTIAPKIIPDLDNGGDYSTKERITFHIEDNFSGIESFQATVDGRWVALDLTRDMATINLRDEGIKRENRKHKCTLRVVDRCGNSSYWEGSIYR